MAKDPAYHRGLKTLVRPLSSRKPQFAPREMVGLFGGGMAHGGCYGGIARGQRLSLVKSLGGHLAGMIDPHQPGRLAGAAPSLSVSSCRGGRRRARGLGGSE